MATNPTGPNKARISIVVDQQLKDRVTRTATSNQISINAYIEGAITEALRVGLHFERRAVYAESVKQTADIEVQASILETIAEHLAFAVPAKGKAQHSADSKEEEDNLLTPMEASRALGYRSKTAHTIHRLVKNGDLPAVRINDRVLRIRQSDLDKFIEARMNNSSLVK